VAIDRSKLTLDQLRELNRLEVEARELQEQGLKLDDEKLDKLRELQRLANNSRRVSEEEIETLKEKAELLRSAIQAGNEDFANKQRILELARVEEKLSGSVLENIRDKMFLHAKEEDLLASLSDFEKEILEKTKEKLDVEELSYEMVQRQVEASQRAERSSKKLLELAFKRSPLEDRILDIATDLNNVLVDQRVGQLAYNQALIKTDQMMQSLYRSSVDAMFKMDQAMSDFNKQFAFGDPRYSNQIRDTYTEMNEFGVTIERATKAQNALMNSVTDFTLISAEQQKALRDSTVLAEGLGVSTEAAAKGAQNSMKFFSQTGMGAANVMGELYATAGALNISQATMAEKFASAGGELAKFGKNGVKAFKDLMHISKITGLEMEKVLGIVNKFDTFEGAAEQAGKLNAALGGNFVNAMDLMMSTDPAERFNMIRDSILNAGLTFDDMSYYQKNFYKEALGLSDVGDLAYMLSGNMDQLAGATNKSAKELIEQKEQAQINMSIQEKFNALIADNSELFLGLADTLQKIMTLMVENANIVKMFIGVLVSLRIVSFAVATAQMFQAAANLAVGKTSKIARGGLFLMAGALGGLAAGLMMASPSQLVIALFALAGAFIAIRRPATQAGVSLQAAVGPMLALGGAVLMIGSGVAVAAAGLSLLVESFSGLGDAAPYAAAAVIGFTVAFGILIGALIALVAGPQAVVTGAAIGVLLSIGGAALMIGSGMGIAAAGISLIISSMSKVIDSATAFTQSLTQLAGLSSDFAVVAAEIENIASAVAKIPENKAVAFTSLMTATTVAATTAGTTAGAANIAAAAGGTVNNAGTSRVATNQPIEVKIDKDTLAKFTLKVISDKQVEVYASAATG